MDKIVKKTSQYRCYCYWSTVDEITYLKNIGTYGPKTPLTRKELLINYKKSMTGRDNWGNIDPLLVLSYVEKEIEKL